MNKAAVAIVGAGILGAGAYFYLTGQEQTSLPIGGTGGAPESKKEAVESEPIVIEPAPTYTYNISLPDPGFDLSSIVGAGDTEPWWVTDPDPPKTETKKSAVEQAKSFGVRNEGTVTYQKIKQIETKTKKQEAIDQASSFGIGGTVTSRLLERLGGV